MEREERNLWIWGHNEVGKEKKGEGRRKGGKEGEIQERMFRIKKDG